MTQNDAASKTNWQAFAEEALDLWQTQLSSMAADPKAREEMAKFVSPFSQAFADWSTAMQHAQKQAQDAAGDATGFKPTGEQNSTGTPDVSGHDGGRDHAPMDGAASEGQGPERSPTPSRTEVGAGTGNPAASVAPQASGGPLDSVGGGDVAQLALRLASLEQKMDQLLGRLSELEKFEQRVLRATALGPRSANRAAATSGPRSDDENG